MSENNDEVNADAGADGQAPAPPAQTRTKTRLPCICGLGCLAIIAALVVLGVAAHKTQQREAAKPEAEPPISITAKDLQKAYETNEVAAKQKYEKKTVQVTGTIENIIVMMGKSHVALLTGQMFKPVRCVFPQRESELAKGDKIIVHGVVIGELIGGVGVHIENCKLVAVVTEPPISITAIELQKAYNDNAVAAKQKYERKAVEVIGTIEDISIMMGKPHINIGTGQMFVTVTCGFPHRESDGIAEVAKGEEITVHGVVTGEPIGGLGVYIEDCKLVR